MAANRGEARGGTALALSAAALHYDDRPGKLSVAGSVGHFKGFTGLSFGVGYATNDSFRLACPRTATSASPAACPGRST